MNINYIARLAVIYLSERMNERFKDFECVRATNAGRFNMHGIKMSEIDTDFNRPSIYTILINSRPARQVQAMKKASSDEESFKRSRKHLEKQLIIIQYLIIHEAGSYITTFIVKQSGMANLQ